MRNKKQAERDIERLLILVAFLVLPALFGLWWMYGLYVFILFSFSLYS